MKLMDKIVGGLAPHECLECNAEGRLLCMSCRDRLPQALPRCYRCHEVSELNWTCRSCKAASPLASVHAATIYDAAAKDLVWRLKFGRTRSAATEIAGIIAARLPLARSIVRLRHHMAQFIGSRPIIITHAPTANARVRQRGYDQAQLIAEALAKHCGAAYTPLLVRRGKQKQVGADRSQRVEQLRRAYRPINRREIAGAHIILVDDVLTTGATLESAAQALLDAGARRVYGVVFAQAVLKE